MRLQNLRGRRGLSSHFTVSYIRGGVFLTFTSYCSNTAAATIIFMKLLMRDKYYSIVNKAQIVKKYDVS